MLLVRARAGDLVLGSPGPLPGLPLHRDHEIDLAEHASNGVGVGQFPRLVQLAKAERTDGGLHVLGVADRALLPRGLDHASFPRVPSLERYPLPTLPARGREPVMARITFWPRCGRRRWALRLGRRRRAACRPPLPAPCPSARLSQAPSAATAAPRSWPGP